MLDSTFISRSFSDQGVRIRIRKEHRIKMLVELCSVFSLCRKRPPQRPLLSPERPPQYMTADQRSAVPHLPAQYPTSTVQGQVFDDRGNADYHYAGAPIRHVPRPVDCMFYTLTNSDYFSSSLSTDPVFIHALLRPPPTFGNVTSQLCWASLRLVCTGNSSPPGICCSSKLWQTTYSYSTDRLLLSFRESWRSTPTAFCPSLPRLS